MKKRIVNLIFGLFFIIFMTGIISGECGYTVKNLVLNEPI